MRQLIPKSVIAVCSRQLSNRFSHTSINRIFYQANAPDGPPAAAANKIDKVMLWLEETNKNLSIENPLDVLGGVLQEFMEVAPVENSWYAPNQGSSAAQDREQIVDVLAKYHLVYQTGGKIISTDPSVVGPASRTLMELIKSHDVASINREFERAIDTVEAHPRDAVLAASNILESICKVFIEEKDLEMPTKQDLKNLFNVIRFELGMDPATVEDEDLKRIITGLLSVVDGVASLRTHAGAAHGAGRRVYKLLPRHARLAVHSAHTVAAYILEAWDQKKQ